jgi:hypothetical protein
MPTTKVLDVLGTGDYTTFATWEDFADGEATADQWAECLTGDLGTLALSTWVAVPTASVYPKAYARAGHATTGFSDGPLLSSGFVRNVDPNLFELDGIRVAIASGVSSHRRTLRAKNCVFDLGNGGVLLQLLSSTPVGENLFQNCLIRGSTYGLAYRPTSTTKDLSVINCTIIGAANHGFDIGNSGADGSHNLTVKNCVAIASGTDSYAYTDAFGLTLTITSGNNAGQDGTATSLLGGSGNQDNIVAADFFTAPGSDDYTIKRTGVGYRTGVATSNTESLNDVTRHSPPDIGAYELADLTGHQNLMLLGVG